LRGDARTAGERESLGRSDTTVGPTSSWSGSIAKFELTLAALKVESQAA